MRHPSNRAGRGRAAAGPRARRLLALLAAALVAARIAGASEATRTLRAEISGADLQNFAVENLAGTMRIRSSAAEEKVVVVATIHAQSDELANAVRLERVAGVAGSGILRVRYPVDVRTIRYREPHSEGEGLDIFSHSTLDYDGRSYWVAPGHGKRLWADLEVQVPAKVGRAHFRNLVGLIDADGVEGSLRFEVASADLELKRLAGDLALEGSSGDTRAEDIRGRWTSEFSSGDLELTGFRGEEIRFKTSSGDVRGNEIQANRVESDTSSGDVSLRRADVEDFSAESSSGDVRLEVEGARLQAVRAHTSSGDVTLGLPRDASFEADADQSSGDMSVGFTDGSSTLRHDKVVAYRRGEGATRIRVETSSGDLSIYPN